MGLFTIYGFGFSAMSVLMAMLYQRALAFKSRLKLSEIELELTKMELYMWYILAIPDLSPDYLLL